MLQMTTFGQSLLEVLNIRCRHLVALLVPSPFAWQRCLSRDNLVHHGADLRRFSAAHIDMNKSDSKWKLGVAAMLLSGFLGWLVLQPVKPKQTPTTGPAPKLVIESDSHDFGSVIVRGKVSHPYKIRNSGAAPLVIRRISTSCGCTVAHMGKTTLQPGEQQVILAELTVRSGRNNQHVSIFSNDPDRPRAALKLFAHGLDRVLLEPTDFNFTELRLGAMQTNTVQLSAGDGQPFNITHVEPPTAEELEITAEALPVNPDAMGNSARWNLRLAIKPTSYRWMEKELSLKVMTNHPQFQKQEIAINCVLRFPLQWVHTSRHFLGVIRPGESRRTKLSLVSDDGTPFKILEAQPLHDKAFQITSEVLEKGDRYRLTLTATIPDGAPEGFLSTRFLIRTDHPEAPTLEPSFSIHVIDR